MRRLRFLLILLIVILLLSSCKASVINDYDSNGNSLVTNTDQIRKLNSSFSSKLSFEQNFKKNPEQALGLNFVQSANSDKKAGVTDGKAADVPDHMDEVDNTLSLNFSQESGFYDDPFELSITASKNSRVYYTLDGSLPNDHSFELEANEWFSIDDQSDSSNIYSTFEGTTTGLYYAPKILIDKATIFRAVAYDRYGNSGNVVTKTYFVGYQNKSDYYDNVAVISLVTAPVNLFDYNTGIYVNGATYDNWLRSKNYDSQIKYWHQPANYKNKGDNWERPAHIDFFENNGELAFSEEIGIRIHGGASRAFLQKSFNLYARGLYGSKNIKYEIFPGLTSEHSGKIIDKFDSLMLRNGGNDTELTKFRDVMIQNQASGLDFSTQASRPAIVFLNGEFWGLYNLQEKYSEDYIKSHYGVDKSNVIIIKSGVIDEGNASDLDYYNELISFATKNNLSNETKYEQFSKMLDIESFIDYVSTEVFVGNVDWGTNNVMLWRSRTVSTDGSKPYEDGRWRFMIYDTEYSTGITYENAMALDAKYNPSKVTDNTFWNGMSQRTIVGKIFNSLLVNKGFRQQFATRFKEIADTTFEKDTVLTQIESYADTYRPMMVDTSIRFRALSRDKAIDMFDYEVNKISNYFSLRHNIIIGYLNYIIPE